MKGYVLSYSENEDIARGWIADDCDDWYFILRKNVVPDCIGRRFLVEGEPVEFEFETRVKKGRTVRDATIVRRAFAETNIDVVSHREVCLVTERRWLLRQLGGLLRMNDKDKKRFRPGSIVESGVVNDGFPTWGATDVKFLYATEGEWLAAAEVVDGR